MITNSIIIIIIIIVPFLKYFICLLLQCPRSILRPTWDWRTKPESRDFDELNHILQESKKLGKALENLSRSKWTDNYPVKHMHGNLKGIVHPKM